MVYTKEEKEFVNEIRETLLAIKKLEKEIDNLYEDFDELSFSNCPHIDGNFCRHKKIPEYANIGCSSDICPLAEIPKKKVKKKENKMDKKYVQLRVVMTRDFMIPVSNEYPEDHYTLINGWTIERIIEDWFKNNRICSYHAAREAYAIGGSEQFIKAFTMEVIE